MNEQMIMGIISKTLSVALMVGGPILILSLVGICTLSSLISDVTTTSELVLELVSSKLLGGGGGGVLFSSFSNKIAHPKVAAGNPDPTKILQRCPKGEHHNIQHKQRSCMHDLQRKWSEKCIKIRVVLSLHQEEKPAANCRPIENRHIAPLWGKYVQRQAE